MTSVDKGARLGNFIIDLLIVVACILTLTLIIQNFYPEILDDNSLAFEIVFSGTIFCYYFFLELLLGQTVGKMLTKTIVVDKNGNKPKTLRLIIRTLVRFIPFEWFTFLFANFGLHDFLSKTTVIKRLKPL
jgi:uncharacterized RDD family membrane protein YckC